MDLLESLINLDGVSGDEHDVRDFIIRECKKYVKNVDVDKMGNVIVSRKGKKPAILFLAHMDEIGLMVKRITRRGRMYISPIGGIDPPILIGQRVFIKGKEKIQGVITTDEVLNDDLVPNTVKMEELFVHSGLDAKELKKKGVNIGTYMSFGSNYDCCTLGSKDVISGKALDDRIGCYILLELMRNLKTKNEIYFVFTVQEEVGLYGAKASVFNLEPDYAIAVDVTGHEDRNDTMILGNGPALTIKDAEMLGNKCLNEALQEVAAKLNINLQLEVGDVGTTDATSIFASKGGIPSAVLGVSVANIHTTIGMAHKEDIVGAVKVLRGFLKNPPAKCWA
ncbi:MAG: M42 family metallopeptidase [Nanoarchaeota archaeon]|nr:M42 family metallopeptidase [Nanoarchaeota archaeon]